MKKTGLILLALVVAAFAVTNEAWAQDSFLSRGYGGTHGGYQPTYSSGGYQNGHSVAYNGGYGEYSTIGLNEILRPRNIIAGIGVAAASLAGVPTAGMWLAGLGGWLVGDDMESSAAKKAAQTPIENWSWRYDSSGRGGWVAEGRQTSFSRPSWVGAPPVSAPPTAPAPQPQATSMPDERWVMSADGNRACIAAGCWVMSSDGKRWERWEPAPQAPTP